jgi:hypothetical protein
VPSTLEHLVAYPPADVERLLRLRPDVLAPPLPRDLRELAERLDDVTSAAAALADATLPTLQAAEAIAALDARATMRTVTTLLAGDERGSAAPADVETVLGWLAERSLIWLSRDADPAIECSPGLLGCFDRPLGLGHPAALLHAGQTAKVLQGVLARLGLRRATSKAEALATLLAWLDDADRVVALASTAPQTVQRWLLQQCVPWQEAAEQAADGGLPSYLLSSSRYREHL